MLVGGAVGLEGGEYGGDEICCFECGRIRAGKEAAGGLVGSGEFGQQWVLGGLGSDGQMVEEGLPLYL